MLSPIATPVIEQIVQHAYWWLAASDVPTLLALAETLDLEAGIKAELDQLESLTLGNRAHPLIGKLLDVRRMKMDLLQKLALDPISRAKLGTVRVEGRLAQSKLDKFIGGDA